MDILSVPTVFAFPSLIGSKKRVENGERRGKGGWAFPPLLWQPLPSYLLNIIHFDFFTFSPGAVMALESCGCWCRVESDESEGFFSPVEGAESVEPPCGSGLVVAALVFGL